MQSNAYLILLRLDLESPQPLRINGFSEMEADTKYSLVAGILDPGSHATSTPLTEIPFKGGRRRSYNKILRRLDSLVSQYKDPETGFIADPRTFGKKAQARVRDAMEDIGRTIWDLLPRRTPLYDWFEELFQVAGDPHAAAAEARFKHVTIVTNDFGIPWYWMKAADNTLFLCEVCSLGLVQLAGSLDGLRKPEAAERTEDKEDLKALLVCGAVDSELPMIRRECDALRQALERDYSRGQIRPLKVDEAAKALDLFELKQKYRAKRRNLFRVVHYSGHWAANSLLLNGEETEIDDFAGFVEGALLTLDGCSTSEGLLAWTDLESLTSQFLRLGALGCVVSVLPVKNDPIVAEYFWGPFYRELRKERVTLGQALVTARREMKGLLEENPAWALYQLIGNPGVHLINESD